jgi:hypothetical protein
MSEQQAEAMTVEQALEAIQDAPQSTEPTQELPPQPETPETPQEGAQAQEPAPQAAAPAEDKLEALRKFQEKARKERETREAELAAKQQYAEVEQAKEMMRLLKEDPIAFVEKAGLQYDDWARSLLNHKPKTEIDALRETVNSLKQQQEQLRAQEAQARQAQAEAAVRNEIISGIKSASQFELINELGMHDAVLDAMQAHYDKTGEIRDVVEVASEVEEWLEGLTAKAVSTSKVKSKLAPAPAAQAPRDGRTITNTQAGAVPARVNNGLLSKEDSIAAAAALLRMQGE